MSQIARCCLCDQRVRIPDVESNVWVRCPHCREEYQLSRIAKDLPPRLEVLENRPLVIDSALAGAADEMPTDLVGVGEPVLTPDKVGGTAFVPALKVAEPVTLDEVEVALENSVPSPQTLHANRVKRSGRGGAMAAVKIALGGVAGLVIGQAILWWLPEPYQSDPFDLAAKVPTSCEFLLPGNLRNNDVQETVVVELGDANVDLFEAPEVGTSTLVEPAMPADATSRRKGNVGGQPVPPTDLNISLQTAINDDTTFDGRSSYERRYVESWAGSLRQLALCVTNIDEIDSVNLEVLEELTRFILRVGEDSKKFAAITAQATAQLRSEQLHNQQGIVLAGSVAEIRTAGEFFRTSVAMGDTGISVDVISRTDPREKQVYAENDRVIVLGVVLKEPANLIGYKGSNHPLVFGGFPVKCDQVVKPATEGS